MPDFPGLLSLSHVYQITTDQNTKREVVKLVKMTGQQMETVLKLFPMFHRLISEEDMNGILLHLKHEKNLFKSRHSKADLTGEWFLEIIRPKISFFRRKSTENQKFCLFYGTILRLNSNASRKLAENWLKIRQKFPGNLSNFSKHTCAKFSLQRIVSAHACGRERFGNHLKKRLSRIKPQWRTQN